MSRNTTFRLLCPHCEEGFRVVPSQSGQLVRCPKCSLVVCVPGALPAEYALPMKSRRQRPAAEPDPGRRTNRITVGIIALLALASAMTIVVFAVRRSEDSIAAKEDNPNVDVPAASWYKSAPLDIFGDLVLEDVRVKTRVATGAESVLVGVIKNNGAYYYRNVRVDVRLTEKGSKPEKVLAAGVETIELIEPKGEMPIEVWFSGYERNGGERLRVYYQNADRTMLKPETASAMASRRAKTAITWALNLGAAVITLGLMGEIGRRCGRSRARGRAGFWLGFCLGPAGWLLALFLPVPLEEFREEDLGGGIEDREKKT
jgi:predicted Zn finger-like uncharacterized protein